MTDEQHQKLRKLNQELTPIFAEADKLHNKIIKYSNWLNDAKQRYAKLQAKLDAYKSQYAAIWQEIFNAREAV